MSEILAEVADIVMGQSPSGSDCNPKGRGVPLLNGPTEFGPRHPFPTQYTTEPKKWADTGALLFCVRGSTTGRMNWADQTYAIGRGLAAVRHHKDISLNPLVRAVIEWKLPYLLAAATGSTFPNVSGHQLANLPWPAAVLGSEYAIANVLSALDDKIECNRRMNETLEAMTQAIFKDWFVDFGPTRRKAAGETDPAAILGGLITNPEKATQTAALFPNRLGDNGLPEGWENTTIGRLVTFNPKEAIKKGEITLYSDMASLPTRGSTANHPIFREFSSGMKFRNGDALLARITPCLENGKAAFVDFLTEEHPVGWGSTEFIVLRAHAPIPKPFAYLLTRWPVFRVAAIQSMTGTSGRQRARVEALQSFDFSQAPNAVYQAFGRLIIPMFDNISQNAMENKALAETRDYLLPRLMSGQIRVAAVEVATETPISNVVPISGDLFDGGSAAGVDEQERDAVMVAAVVRALQKNDGVVGNVKYQKGCYFVHRRMGLTTRDFEKKAAGPYNINIVNGGHRDALNRGYIKAVLYKKDLCNKPGLEISKIDQLMSQYKMRDAIAWVRTHLKDKDRDGLELLATVDYAMVALTNKKITPDANAVQNYIANEEEWAAKLERAAFSKAKIEEAISDLTRLFPAGDPA